MIYVLTGEIRTGKTTRLIKWLESKNNCDGIVSPVLNDKRYLQRISSKELRLLEADAQTDKNEIINIGRYNFNKSIFKWGREILEELSRSNVDWLIIDEVGPLELKGNGFEPVAGKLINIYKSKKENLLLVVRKPMFDLFLQHYNLDKRDILPFNL